MGITGDDVGYGICRDGSGNVYVTGYFLGTVNFAADWGGTDSKTSAGYYDIFVTKINAAGTYGWTHRMGGSGWDWGQGICTDGSGNIYVSGMFDKWNGVPNFAGDWGGVDVKTIPQYSFNIFVTKINAAGTYGWTKQLGVAGTYVYNYGYGICTDASNNVFVTGNFAGTGVNFAADWNGTDSKDSAGGTYDIFVTKIRSDGTYGWTKRMGDTGNDYGYGICTDASGYVYVTGYFQSTVNFRADWSGTESKASAGAADTFVTKMK
jgi:hypothetical protein